MGVLFLLVWSFLYLSKLPYGKGDSQVGLLMVMALVFHVEYWFSGVWSNLVMFHVKHEWGGWVGEVDYLASTISSPGVIEGLVFHVKRGSSFNCLEKCDPVFCGCWSVWSSPWIRLSHPVVFHVKHCFLLYDASKWMVWNLFIQWESSFATTGGKAERISIRFGLSCS